MSLATDSAPAWMADALAHSPASNEISVDGCPIHYLSWNADDRHKPGVLLVHGFCAHAHWWDFVAPANYEGVAIFTWSTNRDWMSFDASGLEDGDLYAMHDLLEFWSAGGAMQSVCGDYEWAA